MGRGPGEMIPRAFQIPCAVKSHCGPLVEESNSFNSVRWTQLWSDVQSRLAGGGGYGFAEVVSIWCEVASISIRKLQ